MIGKDLITEEMQSIINRLLEVDVIGSKEQYYEDIGKLIAIKDIIDGGAYDKM